MNESKQLYAQFMENLDKMEAIVEHHLSACSNDTASVNYCSLVELKNNIIEVRTIMQEVGETL